MNKKKEAKRLIINTILIAFGNLGAKLISFLLLPVYTRILSTESYGMYDFIITLSTFFTPIISLSLYESLFRFLIEAKYHNNAQKIKATISSSIVLTIICEIIYIIISFIVFKISNIDYIPILTLYVVASITYLYLISILRGIDQIKFYALYSGIKNVLQVFSSYIAVAYLNLGINGLLYATIITSLGISIIIFIHFKLWKYISLKKKYLSMVKQMLNYSLPLVPDSVGATIVTMSDRLVVKKYLGNSENGIYSIAHKFPSVIEVIYHFFMTAWNESASRVYEESKENTKNMENYYQSLYNFTQRILIGIVVMILAFMPILFKMLIRGEYIKAFEYVPYLLIGQLLNSIANFYSGILIANKDTKKIARSTLISAVVNIVLNIGLVYFLGMYGILIGTLISNIVLLILRKHNTSKYVKLKENNKYLICTIIIYILMLILYKYDNMKMCILSIIIAVTFFWISNWNFIVSIVNMINKKFIKEN